MVGIENVSTSMDEEPIETEFQNSGTEEDGADDIVDLIFHDWQLVPGQNCIRRHLLSVLRGNATRKWLFKEAADHLSIALDASTTQLLIMVDSSPSAQPQLPSEPVLVLPLEHKESGTWLTGCSILSRALKAAAKRISVDPAKLAAAELQIEGLPPQPVPQDMQEADSKDAVTIPSVRLSIHCGDNSSSQQQTQGQQVHYFMHWQTYQVMSDSTCMY